MENFFKKLSLKKIVIIGIAAIVAIFAMILIILAIAGRRPTVAFYGIPEAQQEQIVKVLQDTARKPGKKTDPFIIKTYNTEKPLALELKHGKRPSAIFMYRSASAEIVTDIASKKNSGYPESRIEPFTSSIRLTTLKDAKGKITTLPLLTDFYQIDINREMLLRAGITTIRTWDDITNAAKKVKNSEALVKNSGAPIIFAGGDDTELINITGALVESTTGITAWNAVSDAVKKNITGGKIKEDDFYALIKTLSADKNTPLYNSLSLLKNWDQSRLLFNGAYRMTTKDVQMFMENELTGIVFDTLGQHRLTAQRPLLKYSTIYYPSRPDATERNFTAPEIIVIPLRRTNTVNTAIAKLASEKQDMLCRVTGLAPVKADSAVPDKQSDDARYWVAASGEPLMPFADALFTDPQTKASFAAALRSVLEYK